MKDCSQSETGSAKDCPRLSEVCAQLEALASARSDNAAAWPQESMFALADHDVFRWFIPVEFGGWNWSAEQILDGYFELSQACLTSTFILTQWHAACRRIISSESQPLKQQLLPAMACGSLFATVGISHLTTSRQYWNRPALRATPTNGGYLLSGCSPWVTAAQAADVLVLGASLDDGKQLLAAVPRQSHGLVIQSALPLMALSASCTGQVDLVNVRIEHSQIVAGPKANVMQDSSSSGGGPGGLHTSILAVGLSMRAVRYLQEQTKLRPALGSVSDKLCSDVQRLRNSLTQLIVGKSEMTVSQIRHQANGLVLRTTQAALQAAKGAGYVQGHPAGRWAREALFFLVWSCPQEVVDANLCDFAGLEFSW